MTEVLVIDDETSIATLVAYNFERAGFSVSVSHDGDDAYQRVAANPDAYDLLVLDWMLPGMDGLEVCKKLRQQGIKTPIILLTARDQEIDLVLGLEIGADDYVTKPFSPRELVARAKAVLRRTDNAAEADQPEQESANSEELRAGLIRMDLERHEVTVNQLQIDLTPREFELLRQLMEHKGRVLSRDQLLDRVWGYDIATDTRIVDVHMSHLREKLERDPKNPIHLKTVRGIGYKFVEGTST
ncbi:response regulator transcription factor [Alicyclobacillus sp. SO9]|nr:response regulator transcription factor [Alicyclobacillus sp. SO9]